MNASEMNVTVYLLKFRSYHKLTHRNFYAIFTSFSPFETQLLSSFHEEKITEINNCRCKEMACLNIRLVICAHCKKEMTQCEWKKHKRNICVNEWLQTYRQTKKNTFNYLSEAFFDVLTSH